MYEPPGSVNRRGAIGPSTVERLDGARGQVDFRGAADPGHAHQEALPAPYLPDAPGHAPERPVDDPYRLTLLELRDRLRLQPRGGDGIDEAADVVDLVVRDRRRLAAVGEDGDHAGRGDDVPVAPGSKRQKT